MIPEFLILDTGTLLLTFKKMATANREYDHFIDDVVAEIIVCLRNVGLGPGRLNEFVRGIHYEHSAQYAQSIPGEYAMPILELGICILKQLKDLQAYGQWDELRYRYYMSDTVVTNCVILKRV